MTPKDPQDTKDLQDNTAAAATEQEADALSKELPTDAWQRKIQLGWIAGGMSAIVSTVALVRFQPDVTLALLWSGLDILIVALFAFGVYSGYSGPPLPCSDTF